MSRDPLRGRKAISLSWPKAISLSFPVSVVTVTYGGTMKCPQQTPLHTNFLAFDVNCSKKVVHIRLF